MSNSLMNTGISGINAAQNMLNVVSNNITNAHTPGYNRQQLVLSQANGTNTGVGFVGNGVGVSSVNRVFNGFVVDQLRQAEAQSSSINAYYIQLAKVDNLFADSDNGISNQMQNLFSGLNSLSSNASDPAGRQSVISNTQSLVNQFNKTEKNLKTQIDSVNSEMVRNVDQINSYSKQIAELNEKIVFFQGTSGGNAPNALLDERDQLVNELNQLVGVTVTEQNGQYNISIANGLTLVQGGNVNLLGVEPSAADPTLNSVVYTHHSGAKQELSSKNITTGALSGLLEFREGPLVDARNQLGLIALNLAERFNEVHMSGVDINGEPGEALFGYNKPNSIANANNKGDAALTINYDSVTDMKASDYRMEFNGEDWVVTRLSDNTIISPEMKDGKLHFDGLAIEVNGDPAAGDSFIAKPVADVAGSLKVLITDPNKLATGIADDENGPGDNRNIEKMLGIQNEKLVGGTKTLNGAYASLVSYIGSETQSAKISALANENIVSQIYEQNQSISGVNIDEEYISMQVYMQYYQANAKIIEVATTIFDTILGLKG